MKLPTENLKIDNKLVIDKIFIWKDKKMNF